MRILTYSFVLRISAQTWKQYNPNFENKLKNANSSKLAPEELASAFKEVLAHQLAEHQKNEQALRENTQQELEGQLSTTRQPGRKCRKLNSRNKSGSLDQATIRTSETG